jgi:CubicO group peptidase (beta-lactamase class C family)
MSISLQRMSIRAALLAAATLACAAGAAAQEAEVDAYIKTQMDARHIPGLSLAVLRNGRAVVSKGYGLANVEHAVPATDRTVFQLASVTKQFTATAVMMLVEDGKIALATKARDILPELPAAWGEVTVRHLLNHTSGIPSYTGVPDFPKTFRKDYTHDEIVALVKDRPMDFAPGEKYRYNNTGYFLLGMVIEKVSGQKWGAFLEARIFQPLGMTSTRANDLGDVVTGRAQGYAWRDGRLRNGDYVSPTQPYSAGSLLGTVADLAKWDAALYTERLLSRASQDLMYAKTPLADGKTQDYGFGWGVDTYRTRKRYAHSGGIPGFSTNITRFVDDGVTVIVLANEGGAAAERIASGVAEFYLPVLREHAPKPVPDTNPQTTAFLKSVITSLSTGAAEREWFTPEAQSFFFPNRVLEGKQMLGAHGSLTSFDLMEETKNDKGFVRGYKAVFGQVPIRCTFTLTADGKISGIGIRPE